MHAELQCHAPLILVAPTVQELLSAREVPNEYMLLPLLIVLLLKLAFSASSSLPASRSSSLVPAPALSHFLLLFYNWSSKWSIFTHSRVISKPHFRSILDPGSHPLPSSLQCPVAWFLLCLDVIVAFALGDQHPDPRTFVSHLFHDGAWIQVLSLPLNSALQVFGKSLPSLTL